MPLPIEKILSSAPLVKKDGNAFVFPEELDANVYIALGQEALQINRMSRLELSNEVAIQTHKGERFFFAADQVVGFRFGATENARHKPGGAGFTKL
jgi:hypothetical protein